MEYFNKAVEEAKQAGYELPMYEWHVVCLDHRFWSALGKARGWETKATTRFWSLGTAPIDHEWENVWHDFIDHLAEGKDAESFFKELLGR